MRKEHLLIVITRDNIQEEEIGANAGRWRRIFSGGNVTLGSVGAAGSRVPSGMYPTTPRPDNSSGPQHARFVT